MLTRRQRFDVLSLYLGPVATAWGAGFLVGRRLYSGAVAWGALTLFFTLSAWFFAGRPPRRHDG